MTVVDHVRHYEHPGTRAGLRPLNRSHQRRGRYSSDTQAHGNVSPARPGEELGVPFRGT